MKSWYVYALVPAGVSRPLGVGLEGDELRVVPFHGIAAVAGPMAVRPSTAPASLLAHDEVVRRIARVSDAILPFRFGAMVTSFRDLEEGLAPRAEGLAAALERTRGCDQMTLRIYRETTDRRQPTKVDAGGPGTRWLRGRAGTAPIVELGPVQAALAPWVRAEVVEPNRTPPLRASVFHLVPRERTGHYRATVDAMAADAAPARLAVTGPWPPYAFAEPFPELE